MSDRCRNRDCRMNGNRQNSNRSLNSPMPPMGQNNRSTPDCRGNIREERNTPYPHAMMKRLQALDFSIADTVLYLDAYPHCQKALNYYHELIGERHELLVAMAEQHHTPITSFTNTDRDRWEWTMGPWPWELGANG